MTLNSYSLHPRKRAITINLDAGLVAQIEILKAEATACGLDFSVTKICATALAEAVPRLQEEMQRRSGIIGPTPSSSWSGQSDS